MPHVLRSHRHYWTISICCHDRDYPAMGCSVLSSTDADHRCICLLSTQRRYQILIDSFNETYPALCKEADKSTRDVTWLINAHGEQSQLKHRSFAVRDISEEYKFSLWWRPKSWNNVPQCITSCQKAFRRLADTDSCKVGDGKVYLAGSGAINIGCGTYSFTAHHQVQSSVTCRNHPLSAPKKDNVADGATSVESTIQTWCNDYDGHIFTGNSVADSVYR
jgi:hypothetical protein